MVSITYSDLPVGGIGACSGKSLYSAQQEAERLANMLGHRIDGFTETGVDGTLTYADVQEAIAKANGGGSLGRKPVSLDNFQRAAELVQTFKDWLKKADTSSCQNNGRSLYSTRAEIANLLSIEVLFPQQ